MSKVYKERTRAQESTNAIERLYISMRHLFSRGFYKPMGVSGETLRKSLLLLRPEIYGSIADPERVELDGLLYVFQRLPKGIEECRFIKLISKEGFENSNFPVIIAPKRRRNSYRIDEEQMYIEMTRGRSDIYDILTHLTFLYVEAEKIRRNSEDTKGRKRREWLMLEEIVKQEDAGEDVNKEVAYTYLSTLLGRTYEETINACSRFAKDPDVNSIFHITYWLGKLSQQEEYEKLDREISFSSALREKVGHHYLGELWAQHIKQFLWDNNLFDRPIHIISANLHSVMNSLFASSALQGKLGADTIENMARKLSLEKNQKLRNIIRQHANKNGMYMLNDTSGMNINVQIIDVHRIANAMLPKEIEWSEEYVHNEKPIILVMDYAFGEQAYETMDELLKPFEKDDEKIPFNVQSVSVMGKAGILEGIKGDIMVATAHVFEGAADNYPVENELSKADFEGHGLAVYEGPMITVLGTSLQNRDILRYFLKASWHAVGLEMEGAHYQKAIQAASKIRNSVRSDIAVRYAYYASDNPLVTGHTLASGSLGVDGVKPTYLITIKILNQILSGK